MYCPKCGTELIISAQFCPNCGSKLPLPQQQRNPQYTQQNKDPYSINSNPQYANQNNSYGCNVAVPKENFGNSKAKKSNKKALIITSVVVFVIIVSLLNLIIMPSNNNPSKAIVGTWKDYLNSSEMTFYSDGRVEVDSYGDGRYSIDSDNTLRINDSSGTITFNYVPLDQVYRYENRNITDPNTWWYIEGDTLYIGSESHKYIRQ